MLSMHLKGIYPFKSLDLFGVESYLDSFEEGVTGEGFQSFGRRRNLIKKFEKFLQFTKPSKC